MTSSVEGCGEGYGGGVNDEVYIIYVFMYNYPVV